mmetsp:Transcript_55219/g.161138  ORF Transcript_55219/g.161138 Transcript_55219/m.161138 type:complete len:258 (+) Transcript_55219:295-1068(+)
MRRQGLADDAFGHVSVTFHRALVDPVKRGYAQWAMLFGRLVLNLHKVTVLEHALHQRPVQLVGQALRERDDDLVVRQRLGLRGLPRRSAGGRRAGEPPSRAAPPAVEGAAGLGVRGALRRVGRRRAWRRGRRRVRRALQVVRWPLLSRCRRGDNRGNRGSCCRHQCGGAGRIELLDRNVHHLRKRRECVGQRMLEQPVELPLLLPHVVVIGPAHVEVEDGVCYLLEVFRAAGQRSAAEATLAERCGEQLLWVFATLG